MTLILVGTLAWLGVTVVVVALARSAGRADRRADPSAGDLALAAHRARDRAHGPLDNGRLRPVSRRQVA